MVTRTYYEGQMPLEEEVIQGGSVQSLTRNFLGGRGLEAITTTDNSVTTTTYPLYDTHGNMVATLTKNASGTSWNLGNERTYDVWGGVRSGNATGGPKGRYCANLGHVQDDESGLIYMRARYYEPSTERFISEDKAMDGDNWFVYATNNPTKNVDFDGYMSIEQIFMVSMASSFLGYVAYIFSMGVLGVADRVRAFSGMIVMMAKIGIEVAVKDKGEALEFNWRKEDDALSKKLNESIRLSVSLGLASGIGVAVAMAYGSYSGWIVGLLWEMDYVDTL